MRHLSTWTTWFLILTSSGCGSSYVPMYSAVAGACIAQERAIVERPDSSEEEDRRDLASIRRVCDDLLSRIEAEAARSQAEGNAE